MIGGRACTFGHPRRPHSIADCDKVICCPSCHIYHHASMITMPPAVLIMEMLATPTGTWKRKCSPGATGKLARPVSLSATSATAVVCGLTHTAPVAVMGLLMRRMVAVTVVPGGGLTA